MKTFKEVVTRYLYEAPAWTMSVSTMLFDLPRAGLKDIKIPLSPSIFKRIWPKSIRGTAFHVTDYVGIQKLMKMQGGKRTISAFYNMDFDMISYGIRTDGGYVAELEADILAAAPDDIASVPDKQGRRWITYSTLMDGPTDYPPGFGGKGSIKGIEQDIHDLLEEILKTNGEDVRMTGLTEILRMWELLGKKAGKKELSLIIKDYIDGMEKIMKKHSKPLRKVFTDYTKKRIQEPDPDSGDVGQWDELVVNNFKIKKVHVGQEFADDFRGDDAIDMYGLPFDTWDDDSKLSDYIAKTVRKKG
tara:strand:- start:156 stop:1061 length:906 start_codon:yes stop_codon:yes gene_type:complete